MHAESKNLFSVTKNLHDDDTMSDGCILCCSENKVKKIYIKKIIRINGGFLRLPSTTH